MTDEQFNKVGHSLGINTYHALHSTRKKDKYLPDEFYRNYYCCGESADGDLLPLEVDGIVERWNKFDNLYFGVTDKGIRIFRDLFTARITSTYVPQSKNKQRYEDYLSSDGWISFSEWLGITPPKLEYGKWEKYGYYRYVSEKYSEVKGEFKTTKKAAKESYKYKLKEYKNGLK
jgi:hypothetical protein